MNGGIDPVEIASGARGKKFPVRPEKVRELYEWMARLGVREEDIEERFVRGSGPGGQKVNKTSSSVRLLHLPTGTEVKCGKERSQPLNRFLARRMLLEKIEAERAGTPGQGREADRIRRQKDRRRRRAGAHPEGGIPRKGTGEDPLPGDPGG